MTRELRLHALRPGGLVDLAFFLSGAVLGFAGLLALELQDLPVAVRHQKMTGGSLLLSFVVCVMPVVFGVFQGRHARKGHLFPRRLALLGTFLVAVAVGVIYYSVTRIGAMWPILAFVLILPWCASRALWTTNHNPSRARKAVR